MLLLRHLAGYCGFLLIAGFTAIAAWKFFTGAISLDGLLDSYDSGRRQSSPARMQLLLFTFGVAAQYLAAVWNNPSGDALPPLPQGALMMLGGSQAVYLGGKLLTSYLPFLKQPR